MKATEYIEMLQSRWRRIFSSLQSGSDVAPSYRLHTEGMMAAALVLRLASAESLQTAMAATYFDVCGEHLAERWGEHWPELFPFPQIPAFSRRAPVYPSTAD